MRGQLQLTAGITMLTHLKYKIKVFAPSRLLHRNIFVNSSKRDGVMPADVSRKMGSGGIQRLTGEQERRGANAPRRASGTSKKVGMDRVAWNEQSVDWE
jgi:hypothetical protein